MADDIVKQTYDQFSTKINLGDEKAFRNALKKKETARQIYDQATNAGFNTGDYETFERAMGVAQGSGTEKVQQPKAPQTAPMEKTEVSKSTTPAPPQNLGYDEDYVGPIGVEYNGKVVTPQSFLEHEGATTAAPQQQQAQPAAPRRNYSAAPRFAPIVTWGYTKTAKAIDYDSPINKAAMHASDYLNSLSSSEVSSILSNKNWNDLAAQAKALEAKYRGGMPKGGSPASEHDIQLYAAITNQMVALENNFSDANEMARNPGKAAASMYKPQMRKTNRYLSYYERLAKGGANMDTWNPFASESDWPESVRAMKEKDRKAGNHYPDNFYYWMCLKDKDFNSKFQAWSLICAEQKNKDWTEVRNNAAAHADRRDEQYKKEAAKKFGESSWFAPVSGLFNSGIGELVATGYRFIDQDAVDGLYDLLYRSTKYASEGQQLASGIFGLGVEAVTAMPVYGGAAVRATSALSKVFTITPKAARIMQGGLSFMFFEGANSILSATSRGNDVNWAEVAGNSAKGFLLGGGGAMIGGGIKGMAPNATGRAANYGIRALGDLAEVGLFAGSEMAMEYLQGRDINVVGSLLSNGAIIFSMKIGHGIAGGKGFGIKRDVSTNTIGKVKAKGYDALAKDLERYNASRFREGEFQLSDEGMRQLEELQGNMSAGGGLSWANYAEIIKPTGVSMTKPGVNSVDVVKEGDKYYVATYDINGVEIERSKSMPQGKAQEKVVKMQKTVERNKEIANEQVYASQRDAAIQSRAARIVADELNQNSGVSPYLEDGVTPNPDYQGLTVDEVLRGYQSISEIPVEQRTPEQNDLVSRFEQSVGEISASVPQVDAVKAAICEQYGITEDAFDNAWNDPKKRKGKEAEACAVYNTVLARGYNISAGEAVGSGFIDGAEVKVLNRVELGEDMKPKNPNAEVYYTDESGKVQKTTAANVADLKLTPDVGAEADRLSNENRTRKYNEASEQFKNQASAYSTEELERTLVSLSHAAESGVDSTGEMAVMAEFVADELGRRYQQEWNGMTHQQKVEKFVSERFKNLSDQQRGMLEMHYIEKPLEFEEAMNYDSTHRAEVKAVVDAMELRDADEWNRKFDELSADDATFEKEYKERFKKDPTKKPRGFDMESPVEEPADVVEETEVVEATPEADVVEQVDETPVETEVETPEAVQPVETDPVQRAKAEAFVDAYFPGLKGDAREARIQETLGSDFEQRVEFDKQDGVNKDRTDAYDAAVAELEKPKTEPVEKIEETPAEDVAKPSQPTEQAPQPENEMQAAEVPEAKSDAPKVEEKETPEAASDRKINELLDFMGLEGKDREYVRDAYLAEPERLEEEYKELQSELQKADEASKEETEKKPEEKKDEEPVAEEESKEDDNVIVDDPDTPMPTKEVKGRKVPDYSKSTPARTRKFIYEDLGYDKETADGVVNDAISAAKDALKKHKKTEPKRPKPDEVFEYAEKKAAWDAKKAELEGEQAYWEEVAKQQKTYDVLNEIREAKTPQSMSDLVNKLRQRYGGSERDGELYDAVTNYEPKNLYEACMKFLASGARFVWDAEGSKKGLKQQTGWGDGERRKMIGMIAKEENGGITPEAAVHKIVDLYGKDLGIGLDQSDVVLNTLLDALQSVKTKGDASAFINARKLANVEDILLKRINGEGREDLEADRRADEEFEALKEQYKDELPENPTVDDVANLMERKRQESEGVDVEGEQQGEETLSNETSGEFEAPSDEVPFQKGDVAKPAKAETKQARDFTARTIKKLRKAGVSVKTATQEEAQRVMDIARKVGAQLQAVFHGSGNDFDAFDHSHIGEGEGYQAFGYGTYVTGVEGIAKHYATQSAINKRFSKTPGYGNYDHYWKGQKIDLSTINPLRMAYDIVQREGTIKKAIAQVERFIDNPEAHEGWGEALEILRQSRKSDFTRKRANYEGERFLYEVEIPKNNGTNYLKWDVPMSREEKSKVVDALYEKILAEDKEGLYDSEASRKGLADDLRSAFGSDGLRGSEVYGDVAAFLGGQEGASKFLHDLGYVGMEYPAQYMTGGRKDGAKNYVIFNEADAKITNKTEFLVTKDGTIYGWHDSDGIHLTEEGFNPDTPLHEYTHGFMRMLKETDPKTYSRVVEGLKESEVWQEVLNDEAYKDLHNDETAVASEVAARLSGRENASRVNTEFDRENIISYANAVAVGARVKNALRTFWDNIAEWFGAKLDKAMPADRFARMTLRALEEGVNPDALFKDASVEKMSAKDIDSAVAKAKETAEKMPELIEFNKDNWDKAFPDGKVITPLGEVKIGENQFEKMSKGRQRELGLMKSTLERPDFVIEESSPEDGSERQSKYVFVKTFVKEDGETYRHYESVTIKKEGNEISISSHYLRENQLKEKLKAGRILYNATSLDAPRKTPLENPTQTNSGAPSGRKDTPEFSVVQENGEKTTDGGERFRDGEEQSPTVSLAERMRERWRERMARAREAEAQPAAENATEVRQENAEPQTETRAENGGGGENIPPTEPPAPQPQPAPRAELPPTVFDRPATAIEKALGSAMKVITDTSASMEDRNAARKELSGTLRDITKAMRIQKDYDKATVENVVAFAREMVNSGLIDHEELSRMNELFTAIKRGTGKTPKGLETVVNRMVDIMLKSQERQAQNEIAQLLNTKAVKTENGIQKQGAVDLRGQHMLSEMNDWMGRSSADIGARLADIRDKKNEIGGRLTDEEKLNNADYRDWDDKETGAMLAQRYQDNVESHAENIRQINEDLEVLKARHKNGEISGKAYTEAKRDLENDLREERIKLIESKWDAAADMNTMITEGRSRAKDFIEAQKVHKDEVLHNGFSDMQRYNKKTGEWEASPATSQDRDKVKDALSNLSGNTLGLSLSTLNSLLKQLGKYALEGKGYLYKRFAYGWVDCAEKEWRDWTEDCNKLDAKANELFGVKFFTDIHKIIKKLPTMEVSYRDGDEVFPHVLDQGQLLYIYCVDKMADGRRNLRFMGIDSDKVNEITEFLDPQLKKMADWLQSDFFVEKRKQYNETYRRMYGADMEAIENYFPLMPDKNQLPKETDIGSPDVINLPSSTTGSMMKRNHKAYALDLKGSNAIDIVIKNLQDTGRWNSFGEWIRDANTLMSSKRFRNQVSNQHTIYGTGENLLSTLEKTFAIAAGAYKPKSDGADRTLVNLSKGVSAGKITYRTFTAIKQLLSLPAFAAHADPGLILEMASRPLGSWNWCMENLPLFEKRWKSRKAGDTRLEDTDLDWNWTRKEFIKAAARVGLTPNAFIDALTISVGARAVYETRYSYYKNRGYSEADADRLAKQDATIAFNETQQSSEGLFVAPLQVDRTWLSAGLSLFRNASMGYTRVAVDGIRDTKRAFANPEGMRQYMKKMYMRDGMTENMAERAAKLSVDHARMTGIAKFVVGAFLGPFAWNMGGQLPYMVFGDNDEEKKKRAKNALWGAAMVGWLEGLAGGNIVSNLVQSIHQDKYQFDPDLMPFSSDLAQMLDSFFKKDKNGEAHTVKGWVELANIVVASVTGVNPQTVTDIVVDIFDGINSVTPDKKTGVAPNLGLAKEIALHMMRIMQVPQSQLDQIFIDEINMTAADAQKLTPKQLAARIAYYKLHRETPMPLAYAYSNEKLLQQVKNKEQQFFTKLNEGAEDPASLRVLIDKNKNTDKGKTYVEKWLEALEKEGPTAMLNARKEESAKGNWYLVQRIDKRLNKAEKSAQDEAIDLASYESNRAGYVAKYLDEDQSILYYDWAKMYEPYSDKKNEVCKKLMALGGERNGKAGHWKYKKNKDKVARGASPKAFNDYYKEHKAEADMCYKFYRIDKEIGDLLSSIDAEKDPQKRDQLISKLMQKILEGKNAGSDKK